MAARFPPMCSATSAVTNTVAVPIRIDTNLWSTYVVPPSRDESDSTIGYSGPWTALGIWLAESSQFNGSGKPRPRAIVFAVTW